MWIFLTVYLFFAALLLALVRNHTAEERQLAKDGCLYLDRPKFFQDSRQMTRFVVYVIGLLCVAMAVIYFTSRVLGAFSYALAILLGYLPLLFVEKRIVPYREECKSWLESCQKIRTELQCPECGGVNAFALSDYKDIVSGRLCRIRAQDMSEGRYEFDVMKQTGLSNRERKGTCVCTLFKETCRYCGEPVLFLRVESLRWNDRDENNADYWWIVYSSYRVV